MEQFEPSPPESGWTETLRQCPREEFYTELQRRIHQEEAAFFEATVKTVTATHLPEEPVTALAVHEAVELALLKQAVEIKRRRAQMLFDPVRRILAPDGKVDMSDPTADILVRLRGVADRYSHLPTAEPVSTDRRRRTNLLRNLKLSVGQTIKAYYQDLYDTGLWEEALAPENLPKTIQTAKDLAMTNARGCMRENLGGLRSKRKPDNAEAEEIAAYLKKGEIPKEVMVYIDEQVEEILAEQKDKRQIRAVTSLASTA